MFKITILLCTFVISQSREDLKLYQPWKFPSLVSLPLHPQRGPNNLLRIPEARANTCRSPSMPVIKNRGTHRSKSNFLSNRSDSEPTMCLSLTPGSVRRPSIVLTKASVEQEETWNGSIGSRLPSHLSLGSTDLNPTPAPTTPMSLFAGKFPLNRSVTPILFPEHQINSDLTPSYTRPTSTYLSPYPSNQNLSPRTITRSSKALSKSHANLRRKANNFLSPAGSRTSLNGRGSTDPAPPSIQVPSLVVMPAEPDKRERMVMTGVIKEWTRQASFETRV